VEKEDERLDKPYIGVLKCDGLPDPLTDFIAAAINILNDEILIFEKK